MENNKFTEKLFTYTAEQKLELAEEMMSQFGSRIASIDGKLNNFTEKGEQKRLSRKGRGNIF